MFVKACLRVDTIDTFKSISDLYLPGKLFWRKVHERD